MTKDTAVIRLSGVSKAFRLPHEKHSSVKSLFINMLQRKRTYEKQQVLKNVSFEVGSGEFFGVVGRNGSGKSTLLKLLAGIYATDKGSIIVNGRLTPFIELGVGFNPELTGSENVYLNGALLGFTRKEIAAMYDEIVDFAELNRFMDQKLKNYSSGMQVRLAFSIAIKANSDILLLDEVLAVGDAAFQKKCFNYFRQLKKERKTVIFISHDMNAVREYCDRAVLLEKGEIVAAGSADKVAQEYTKLFLAKSSTSAVSDEKRWGTGEMQIEKIDTTLNKDNLIIEVQSRCVVAAEEPIFGVTIVSPTGTKIFESNTKWQRQKTGSYKPGDIVKVCWEIPNIFTNGTNYVSVAVANRDASEFFDWWDEAASFIVDKDEVTTAVTLTTHKIELRRKDAN